MMGWVLFAVASLSVLLGLFNAFKSPDSIDWRIPTLVSQFGYALALIPLVTGILTLSLARVHGAAAAAAGTASAVGIVLLVQPCVQAWVLGRRLPRELAKTFGNAQVTGHGFSFPGLFLAAPVPVPKTTRTYSGALQLDFYPALGRSPAPCVIVIHGGGWDNGSRDQLSPLNDWIARLGYAVAAISYRLAPGAVWPAQRDDVAAAVAHIKAHAVELGVDPSRLVLLGRSAGGQIAEACAYGFHDPAICGVIALYAPADMNFAYQFGKEDDVLKSLTLLRQFLGGTPETARAAYDSASGILLVGPASPPTLMVHGKIDTLVWHKQSERLSARLKQAGVRHALVSMPWATHGLEYNQNGPSGQLALFAMKWFLSDVCG
jgi:acetyl esterase/lipase